MLSILFSCCCHTCVCRRLHEYMVKVKQATLLSVNHRLMACNVPPLSDVLTFCCIYMPMLTVRQTVFHVTFGGKAEVWLNNCPTPRPNVEPPLCVCYAYSISNGYQRMIRISLRELINFSGQNVKD